MREKISDPGHRVVADGREEHVRLQFYTILRGSRDALTVQYFTPNGPYDGSAIDRRSVAVIFDFAKWPTDMADPLSQVDDKEIFARGAVPIDFLEVESYLEQYQPYWDQVQDLKNRLNH
jgi:hypothetical protein